MRVTTLLTIALISLAGALPAAATGTLNCSADAGGIAIDVSGIVPYGQGAPLLQVEASIAAEIDGIGKDMTNLTYNSNHQVQYWLDDESLNLLFLIERSGDGPFGSTMLTIKTSRTSGADEGSYSGTYVIEASDFPSGGSESVERRVKGSISCSAG